tara:strand:+ start:1914 stop:3080 length:1167 start_codon:yes stop_codon:yes gene_type:complete
MKNKSKLIVISAVNQIDGGTLRILDDFLDYLNLRDKQNSDRYIALVHRDLQESFEHKYKNISFIGYSWPKRSWLLRLIFENLFCYFIAKKLSVSHWISLHDLTPKLPKSVVSCVYCHNPSPFHKINFIDFLDIKFVLFVCFYKYVYKLNIHRNKFVVVQQKWLKDFFEKSFHVERVYVVPPDNKNKAKKTHVALKKVKTEAFEEKKVTFIYPCVPRTYKNIELIIQAFNEIKKEMVVTVCYEVILTVDKNENLYAKYLHRLSNYNNHIKFVGRLKQEQVLKYYRENAILVFPSRLETWGLPLSEAKEEGTRILAANLQFVHETLNGYANVDFFEVEDYTSLKDLIVEFLRSYDVDDDSDARRVEKQETTVTENSADRWQEQILNYLNT